jgi:hypothetical protein
MLIVAPGYLSDRTLPFVSDIFFHEKLLYFLPTGFHPLELHAVGGFPHYCHEHSVALPAILWEMCKLYFQNSPVAVKCLEALEPLRNKFVFIASTSYARDRQAIAASEKTIKDHPVLFECFKSTDFDLRFISRELLSHLLFEIFIEDGYNGTVTYLQDKSQSPDDFVRLLAAVCLNRLRIFSGKSTRMLVYEHEWYPLSDRYYSIVESNYDDSAQDDFRVEHFRYKLFEALLLPIYGRCDSKKKAETVANTVTEYRNEIATLKKECWHVARDVILLPTKSPRLKEDRFSELV